MKKHSVTFFVIANKAKVHIVQHKRNKGDREISLQHITKTSVNVTVYF